MRKGDFDEDERGSKRGSGRTASTGAGWSAEILGLCRDEEGGNEGGSKECLRDKAGTFPKT